VIQVLGMSPLTNKELCSLAFECQVPPDFPVVNWNVTFPDKPKPPPRPPQPPTVVDFRKRKDIEEFSRIILARITEIECSAFV
jgi:hypothetical protein